MTPHSQKTGYIHVYTGDGKGKTTAALGLALRALGAGKLVYLGQFMKTDTSSELVSLERFGDQLVRESFGSPAWVLPDMPRHQAQKLAQSGWQRLQKRLLSEPFDLVILDEINMALHFELLEWQQVEAFLRNKPSGLEVVCTGRGAPQELIDLADLVTEMVPIKHYYEKGVHARKGIEY